MQPFQARAITASLCGLAEVNAHDFRTIPGLCEEYATDFRDNRFVYTSDRETCGLPDCWSSYLSLRDRYKGQDKIPLDCEDISCAHAAYLQVAFCLPAYVGLRVGQKVAHCVCGYVETDEGSEFPVGSLVLLDPSISFGMPPLIPHYNGIYWQQLADIP